MKIMQVNCVFKSGSTGKIVYDMHRELQNCNIDSIVCYGRGESICESYVYKTCTELYGKIQALASRITGIMYGGCIISTMKLISIIIKEKPDIVHLHCLNGHFVNIYRLIGWLKKNRVKTVLTLHAEFMYTGGCGHSISCNRWNDHRGCSYCPRWRTETKSWFFDRTHTMWKRMKKAFEGFDTKNLIIVSVSPWLGQRAKNSPLLNRYRHETVLNGLDTHVFCPTDFSALKRELGLTDEKIVLHVTPDFSDNPNHIKGGYYVIELAKHLQRNNIKVIVVGNARISSPLPPNIITLGQVSNQKLLATYYSMADVSLLTSQRETFSMICAESLACGTPIVGFKAGAPETISIREYSEFVPFSDVNKLETAINKWIDVKIDKLSVSEAACKIYDRKIMGDKYHNVYKGLLI